MCNVPKRDGVNRIFPSHVVIEITLGTHTASQLEDLRRRALGIELDIIAGSSPEIARIAEQFVHLIGVVSLKAERLQREINPPSVGMMGIEVDNDQDNVSAVCSALAVTNQLLIID